MKTSYTIQNLKCSGCASTITTALEKMEGVDRVEVGVDNSEVIIESASEIDTNLVSTTLTRIGYPIKGDDNPLTAKAKSYVSCAIGRMNGE